MSRRFDMKIFERLLKNCLDACTLEEKLRADSALPDFIESAIRAAQIEALESVRPNLISYGTLWDSSISSQVAEQIDAEISRLKEKP